MPAAEPVRAQPSPERATAPEQADHFLEQAGRNVRVAGIKKRYRKKGGSMRLKRTRRDEKEGRHKMQGVVVRYVQFIAWRALRIFNLQFRMSDRCKKMSDRKCKATDVKVRATFDYHQIQRLLLLRARATAAATVTGRRHASTGFRSETKMREVAQRRRRAAALTRRPRVCPKNN